MARKKIIPRIPLIPKRTANRENLMALARFLVEQGYRSCDLLAYNPGGIRKRQQIGMTVPLDLPESFLDAAVEEEMRAFFTRLLAGQKLHCQ